MKLKTIIRLLSPLAILIMATIGWLFAPCYNALFLAILVTDVVTRGVSDIVGAVKEIRKKVDSKLNDPKKK